MSVAPANDLSWRGCRVLVVSPTPTHPQDYGNRKYIYETLRELKAQGAEIHFVHYASEQEWRHRRPRHWEDAMAAEWASYQLIAPSRELHMAALGEDHEIDEWADDAVTQYVRWITSVQNFDAVIVNYTWMSYCLEAVPAGVFKILDTNDVFSGRRALLAANGIAAEYFHTTPEEEARAVARADLVWAIKPAEEAHFKALGAERCVTLLHVEPEHAWWTKPPSTDGFLRAGTIGARNNVNRRNLEKFLAVALPLFERYAAPVKIVVAGGCSRDFESHVHPNVEVIGRVEEISDFYRNVDVVIAPMEFSTGLKIKVSEALASGAPLIAHEHASEGYPSSEPLHNMRSFEAMAMELVKLSFDPSPLARLAAASHEACAGIRASVLEALAETRQALSTSTANEILVVAPFLALDPRSLLFDHLLAVLNYLRFLGRAVLHLSGPVIKCDVDLLRQRGIDVRYYVDPETAEALGGALPESWTQSTLVDALQSRGVKRAYFLRDAPELKDLAESRLQRAYVRCDVIELAGGDATRLVDTLRSVTDVALLASDVAIVRNLGDRHGVTAVSAVPYRRDHPFESFTTSMPKGPKPTRMLIVARSGDSVVAPLSDLAAKLRTETVVLDPASQDARDAFLLTSSASPDKRIDVRAMRLIVDLTEASALGAVIAEGAIRANVPVLRLQRGRSSVDRINSDRQNDPSTFGDLLRRVSRLLADEPYRKAAIARLAADVESRTSLDAGWNWLWRELQNNEEKRASSAATSILSVADMGAAFRQLEALAQNRVDAESGPLFKYSAANLARPQTENDGGHVDLHINTLQILDRRIPRMRVRIFTRPRWIGIEIRPDGDTNAQGDIVVWPDSAPSDKWGKVLRLRVSTVEADQHNWPELASAFGGGNLEHLCVLLTNLGHVFARAASAYAWDSPIAHQTWLQNCRRIKETAEAVTRQREAAAA